MLRATSTALLLALASCAATSKPAPPPEKTGAERFAELEARLLGAERVHVAFDIRAEGGVTAELAGALEVRGHQRASCSAMGTFAGAEVEPSFEADESFLHGGTSSRRFEIPTPTAVDEGILLGCTRMGLLHNLAMLSNGAPPDGCDGTVRDFTRPANVVAGKDPEGGGTTLAFDILVRGEEAGKATLYLGPDGLPTRRTQTVNFPGGTMRVEERYSEFALE